MKTSHKEHLTEDESFYQLIHSYTQLKEEHDRLQSYNNLLVKILEYYKITYPPYYSPDEIVF